MAPRKAPSVEKSKDVLAAIVLADSFTKRFRPMTVERAKVLLPLVNVPMIDYTLEWLASNGVEEAFVFCCANADQVVKHISTGRWAQQRRLRLTPIVSTSCLSAGEALRLLDQRDCVKSDFILLSGDVVANLPLAPVLAQHRARRALDASAIMTLIMKPAAGPGHRVRLGDNELLVALDPATNRLLKCEEVDAARHAQATALDAQLFGERNTVALRTDLINCDIYICAPEVLMLFTDNFDYQNIRRDFVSGVLSEEELGNKLYVHELAGAYAARVHNLRSYDAVSRDILQRWTFPLVPDTNLLPPASGSLQSTYRYARQNVYKEQGVTVARTAVVGRDTCLGTGSSVGEGTQVTSSVIGRNCRIGNNCHIYGSYIHDNVTVMDGVHITSAMVCEGAVLLTGAQLQAGVVVSYRVVVGQRCTVPASTRLSLCRQRDAAASGSEDELEYSAAGGQSASQPASGFASEEGPSPGSSCDERPSPAALAAAAARSTGKQQEAADFDEAVVGTSGAGYVWTPRAADDDCDTRYSLMPPAAAEPLDEDSDSDASADIRGPLEDTEAAVANPEAAFRREVAETFLRCMALGFDQSNAVIELNGLKIAEDRTFADCARYIFTTILGLCLPAPPSAKADYRRLYPLAAPDVSSAAGKSALLRAFAGRLRTWAPLLQRFLRSEDEQVELLLTLEEYAGEEGEFEAAGERGSVFAAVFPQVLQQLYEADVVTEDAFLAWANEKAAADEHERVFLAKAQPFVDWLRTAESEDDEEGSEDGSQDE